MDRFWLHANTMLTEYCRQHLHSDVTNLTRSMLSRETEPQNYLEYFGTQAEGAMDPFTTFVKACGAVRALTVDNMLKLVLCDWHQTMMTLAEAKLAWNSTQKKPMYDTDALDLLEWNIAPRAIVEFYTKFTKQIIDTVLTAYPKNYEVD